MQSWLIDEYPNKLIGQAIEAETKVNLKRGIDFE